MVSDPSTQRNRQPIERIALGINEVAESLSMSRRSFERLRAAKQFPDPDRIVGKRPLWATSTVFQWVKQGGGR